MRRRRASVQCRWVDAAPIGLGEPLCSRGAHDGNPRAEDQRAEQRPLPRRSLPLTLPAGPAGGWSHTLCNSTIRLGTWTYRSTAYSKPRVSDRIQSRVRSRQALVWCALAGVVVTLVGRVRELSAGCGRWVHALGQPFQHLESGDGVRWQRKGFGHGLGSCHLLASHGTEPRLASWPCGAAVRPIIRY